MTSKCYTGTPLSSTLGLPWAPYGRPWTHRSILYPFLDPFWTPFGSPWHPIGHQKRSKIDKTASQEAPRETQAKLHHKLLEIWSTRPSKSMLPCRRNIDFHVFNDLSKSLLKCITDTSFLDQKSMKTTTRATKRPHIKHPLKPLWFFIDFHRFWGT